MALVALVATFISMVATAEECTRTSIGIDPDSANGSTGLIHNGTGQTFWADDTLLVSLAVWRVASQDSNWNIGLRPYVMETDSAGAPDIYRVIHEGSTLIIPNGDGINPIEFRWEFNPPVALPRQGQYAFFLFQDPCAAYFDVIAVSSAGGAIYSDGEAWFTFRSASCTLIPGMASSEAADIIFEVEFCEVNVTPVRATSWGELKTLYR